MAEEIRIYKRYDLDLMALHDAGYPVAEMMKMAVCGLAHGSPVHFIIPEFSAFDLRNRHSFRTRFTVPATDTQTKAWLKNIKHGYKCSYCKMVLRDALIYQNLGAYYSNDSFIPIHNKRLEQIIQGVYGDEKVYLLNKELAQMRKDASIIKMGDSSIFDDKSMNRRKNRKIYTSKKDFILIKTQEVSSTVLNPKVSELKQSLDVPHKTIEEPVKQVVPTIATSPVPSAHIRESPSVVTTVHEEVSPQEPISGADNDDLMAAFESLMD